MKSDEMLQEILEQAGLPVRQYEYKGTKPAYIVYNEEDEYDTDYADDCPGAAFVWWQIHLFTPKGYDFRKKKREIRRLLMEAGFSYSGSETFYEQETGTMHVVMSCNTIEDMEE